MPLYLIRPPLGDVLIVEANNSDSAWDKIKIPELEYMTLVPGRWTIERVDSGIAAVRSPMIPDGEFSDGDRLDPPPPTWAEADAEAQRWQAIADLIRAQYEEIKELKDLGALDVLSPYEVD